MSVVSKIEDEIILSKVKLNFDTEKKLYQSEQATLLNAHIFGRYQYLRAENKFSEVSV